MTNKYRTHTCGQLRKSDAGAAAKLSGWVHRKRDHGGLSFLDLRDNYGITQCVVNAANPAVAAQYASLKVESVICVSGKVVERAEANVNKQIDTGQVELVIEALEVLSAAETLPMPVFGEEEYPEDIRLKYRFLDLRRQRLHRNVLLRAQIISYLRGKMIEQGFVEFQTPILTASSPEGARDFLVPSRLHPGKFYALPQAPQIFKQLLMVSGFDRYFQIATCFRDEDGRADRSPTEFYQLDFEMSFVEQDDIFNAIEPVLHGVFTTFANGKTVSPFPFKRIPYDTAMLKYGSDKPDLRNPIEIVDASAIFAASTFDAFKRQIDTGGIVRAIPVPGAAGKPRSYWDGMNAWAIKEGAPGLGYLLLDNGQFKGPIAKFLSDDNRAALIAAAGLKDGDAVFFVCGTKAWAPKFAGAVRKKVGEELELIDKSCFNLCWIVDFPMYELNEDTGKVDFSHNPFSMPQGGMDALLNQDPLSVKAYQYDIVCNGYELSSGAIRNHLPEIMYKAFELAGYTREDVESRFGGLLNAFKFGAPPHGGSAPGIDRIVMLLADEPNLREVTAFPTNQQGEDLMLAAPTPIDDARLKELHIAKLKPQAAKKAS